MRTKICGIRNAADARVAIEAGASAVGFLVGITHLAEDKIDPSDAREIIRMLPPFVSSVMVTHLTEADQIVDLARQLNPTTIQIHDYVDPSVAEAVKKSLGWIKTIKAIPVVDRVEALELVKAYQGVCDALLLDSVTKGRIGGTGKTHDWTISKEIIEASQLPVFLAGGLNPDNVAEAARFVRPYGVDVNSGVELHGYKDAALVRRFIENAQIT